MSADPLGAAFQVINERTAERDEALAALSAITAEREEATDANARLKQACDRMGKKLAAERIKAMSRKLALNDLGRAKDASAVRRELKDAHDRVIAERNELREERNRFHEALGRIVFAPEHLRDADFFAELARAALAAQSEEE